MNVKSELVCR